MSRIARGRGDSDVYHVVARGVNQALVFEDDQDRSRFMLLLSDCLHQTEAQLYCWCLMGNHVHLLIHADVGALSQTMRRLLARYALYFNARHGRSGHLFQDRFRSEPVDSDEYLLCVVRYIHWNPIKAGLSATCQSPWSSYAEYLGAPRYCETARVLDVFGGREEFSRFHDERPGEACLDVAEVSRWAADDEIVAHVEAALGPGILTRAGSLGREERDEALRAMKGLGISLRRIQRLTGIGKNIIERA